MFMRRRPGPVANLLMLAFFVGLALAVGYLGSQATTPALDPWYAGLTKPALNPPNWVFPVVWTSLFVLMGIAAWAVWRTAGLEGAGGTLSVYLIQLGLNLTWSVLFFGQQRPDLAFMEIWALLAAIVLMLALFWRHSRIAGLLIVPYLVWVSFAAYLNFSIVALNP